MKKLRRFALFTCDTEFTPPWNRGSWEEQDRTNFEEGIENIEKILSEFKIRGTFYCQGLLVRDYPDIVRRLAKNHLIGSHGYNHENYGGRPVKVKTEQQPVFLEERKRKYDLLKRCKEIHKEVVGYEPEVFVAPFDSVDYKLLEILKELNFRVDSSFNNYVLGLTTELFRPYGVDIYELPLGVIRFKEYGYKNVLQGLAFDYSKISKIAGKEIIYITCHPYEFVDMKIPHEPHELIVGDTKSKTLKRLILDLKNEGYKFVDPLGLVNIYEPAAVVA